MLCTSLQQVGRDKTAPGGVFRVAPQNILFTPDAANDFPVTMNASKAQSLLYMVTKMGYLFLFDIFSGKVSSIYSWSLWVRVNLC